MHKINYFFIAIIFLFAGVFIGMFVATWHYLDNPMIKEVEKQPVNVENHYYFHKDENYYLLPTPPYHPDFRHPNPGKTSLQSAIYF